jgi:hypothetical protein
MASFTPGSFPAWLITGNGGSYRQSLNGNFNLGSDVFFCCFFYDHGLCLNNTPFLMVSRSVDVKQKQ